ncbi:hypothetical protein B296_00055403 [Ensete ventricosum]|uniref:Uncharacterized protein n=1 Tax=Ensete ventricosum TaxID=4639 RepID=A0A426WVY1_ENSVE|nr:hypothetical protein B296_00055403 [Ensete ventricosum]
MHRVDTNENSLGVRRGLPRVLRVYQDNTREFVRRRPRLIGRLSGVVEKLVESWDAMELQPDDAPRSSLGIGPGSDVAVGFRREFARRFVEGIGKLAENTPGDRQKKTIGLTTRMLEVARLDGS